MEADVGSSRGPSSLWLLIVGAIWRLLKHRFEWKWVIRGGCFVVLGQK